MKTREEQIQEAAKSSRSVVFKQDFIDGARWADENPLEFIGDLITQRSIAFDEARDAREALAKMNGTQAYNIQLMYENERLIYKIWELEEELKELKK